MMRFLVLLALVIASTNGRPKGAPPPACKDLKAIHYEVPEDDETPLNEPQEGFPFEFVPAKKMINGREVVGAVLQPTADGPETFKGFTVRVETADGEPVGTFIPDGDESRNIECEEDLEYLEPATITHTNNNTKSSVFLEWDNEGIDPEGDFVLIASVVEKYDTWWHVVEGQKSLLF